MSRRDVWTHQEQHRHARPWPTARASTPAHVPVPRSRRREASFRVEGGRGVSGVVLGAELVPGESVRRSGREKKKKKGFRQKKTPRTSYLILSYRIPPILSRPISSYLIRYRYSAANTRPPPPRPTPTPTSPLHHTDRQTPTIPPIQVQYLSLWRRKQSRRQRPVSRNGIPSLHCSPSQSSPAQS